MNRIKVIFLSLLAFVVASCGCTKKRVLPETDGTFERYTQDMTFHSDILNTDIRFSIYLPASYVKEKNKTYPVVYMLHGYGDNNNSWNGKYLHANTKINALENNGLTEMIYVYPCGFNSYYSNKESGKYNYMDMFVQELIPYIDKNFRTIADRQHRSITGYSMGGFGAMVLAEKHPELFLCSAPLSMSFRTDAQYMTESQSGWDGQWGSIFGGVGQPGVDRLTDYYKAHCPFYQFVPENKATLGQVHWFFTCGDDEEQLLIANDTLHVQLMDNGYEHEFRVGDGGHSSSYWMDALSEVLPFFDHYMNGAGSWPTINQAKKKDITVREDGTVASSAFVEGEAATGVFVSHDGLTENQVSDILSVFFTTNNVKKIIYLPCDLTQKSLGEWMSYYADKYPAEKKVSVAIHGAGEQAIALKAQFDINVFVDAKLGSEIVPLEGETFYFALTDEGANYSDMGALYRACKRNGAKFEYRVINASEDSWEDVLRSAGKIVNYISY